MKIYEGSKWIDWETRDAACWLAAKTGLTREAAKHAIAAPGVVEEDAPLMAWWRRWAAEGGSRHA